MHHHIRLALALSVLAFAAPLRATEFDAGDGSPASPYVIRNAAQLAKFRDIVNGANGETKNSAACARLAADIDLGGAAWTPIGTFAGTFDGQGHTIGGLSVDLQSGDVEVYAGLFGYLDENATVKDLGVRGDVAVRGSGDNTYYYAGGIAGWNNGTVEGCFHTGSVTADSSRSYSWVGGVAGENYGTVRNCRHAGSVTSKSSDTAWGGGVVGDNAPDGAARNCYAVGTVTATGDGSKFVGGVAGFNHGTMENCYYDTTVAGAIGAVAGRDGAGATGKTTAEMQGADALSRLALNAGLDDDAWTATAGYPELKAFVAYPLWIGGVRFTAGNLVIDADDDPEITSGTATFDPASNTLSLTNFVYSGAGHSWTVEPGTENEHTSAACIFYSGADALAVSLSGTNSVALSAADPALYSSYGFRSSDNYGTAVSFAGAGSLSARAGAAENSSYGVDVRGPLAVAAGAEVAGAAGAAPSSGGVAAFGRIEVGGRLAGTGGASSNTSEGIACYTMGTSEIVVSEGASVAAAGGAARLSYGILAKTLTVNGGEVTAEGGEATTRSRALSPPSGNVALAVADGLAVFAGEDADGAAPVEDDAWRTARYVRVAPAAYPVWVAGRQVTGANAANVLGDASASVSFAGTATNGTLTLRDAVIEEPFGYVPGQSNYGYIAIYTKSGSNFALTVALEGTNRVGSAEFASGFQTWSPLTITGGGVLFAVADDVAIFSYPSVLIDGATVFAEGRGSGGRGSRGWGIEASGFAATNATVQATGASVGITANGVWIGGDSTVVAEGGTAALGCYPPENFSLGDGLAVLEPAGGTPDLYVPILGRIFISSGGAAATRVVIGPPPPAVAATVTFNNGNGAVVYDGQGHGVEVEVTDPAEGAAVLFALGDSSGPTETFGPTAPMFTNACDATVWVEISAEGYSTVTNSARVTIEPATLTITAKDQTYVYNGQPQGEADPVYADPADIAAKVDVAGLVAGDTLAGIVLTGQRTEPGTEWIVPYGATVTNATGVVTFNYAVGYANGTLTIEEPPPPGVSNVVARQRWPWNGLVDVDYEVGGYTEGLEVRISFAKQGDEGRPLVATRFLAGTEPSAVPGRHRATWDAAADGAANFVASNLVATVALVEPDVWLLPPGYVLINGDIYDNQGDNHRSADDIDTDLIVAPGDSGTCLLISSYEDANGDTRYKQIDATPSVSVESDEKDMFSTTAEPGKVTVTLNQNTLIGSSAAISCSVAGCQMKNSLTFATAAMRGIKLYLPESGRPTMYDKNAWDVYARLVPFADNSREVEAGATYQKATLSNDRLDELLVQGFSYIQNGNTFVQDMYRLEASVPESAAKVLVLFELRAKNAADGDWGFVMPAYMIDLSKSLYEEDRNYTENDYVPYDADYFFPLWTAEFNTNQTPFGTYKGNAKTKAFKVGDGVGFHTGRMTGSEGSGQGLWTINVSHVRPLDAAVIEGGLDDGNMKAVGTGETCLLGSWYGVEGIVYPIHFTELSTNPSTYSAEPTLLSVTE